MSPANKTGNSSGNSIHHQNPLSREGSIMESNNDDVDSTRCFPFGFRFGLGSRSKKAKKAKTGEDISVGIFSLPCDRFLLVSFPLPASTGRDSSEWKYYQTISS